MKGLGEFLLILGIILAMITTSYLGDSPTLITQVDIVCYLLEFFMIAVGLFLIIHFKEESK